MVEAREKQRNVERYLEELRAGLRGMPADEASEIVEEIRSHIHDSAAEGGLMTQSSQQATLERLGPAKELASRYVMQSMAARAEDSRSHFLALRTIARWAKVSVVGCGVLAVSIIGYGLAAIFAYPALAKPFRPDRVGLWRLADPTDWSFSLGAVDQPGAKELLGWWIIPLGLFLGGTLLLVTQRFVMWSIRRLQSHPHYRTQS